MRKSSSRFDLQPSSDSIGDMLNLLDKAGVDRVDAKQLDNLIHRVGMQWLVDFAVSSSREAGRRITWQALLNSMATTEAA